MLKKILFFFSLIFLATVFYIRFQNYQPKILKRLTEVRGISIQRDILPYPMDSTKVSETKTLHGEQITLRTTASNEKINNFYKNILLEDNWKIEAEDLNDNFSIVKFKKDEKTVTVISSLALENGNTVFSLEIKNN